MHILILRIFTYKIKLNISIHWAKANWIKTTALLFYFIVKKLFLSLRVKELYPLFENNTFSNIHPIKFKEIFFCITEFKTVYCLVYWMCDDDLLKWFIGTHNWFLKYLFRFYEQFAYMYIYISVHYTFMHCFIYSKTLKNVYSCTFSENHAISKLFVSYKCLNS